MSQFRKINPHSGGRRFHSLNVDPPSVSGGANFGHLTSLLQFLEFCRTDSSLDFSFFFNKSNHSINLVFCNDLESLKEDCTETY